MNNKTKLPLPRPRINRKEQSIGKALRWGIIQVHIFSPKTAPETRPLLLSTDRPAAANGILKPACLADKEESQDNMCNGVKTTENRDYDTHDVLRSEWIEQLNAVLGREEESMVPANALTQTKEQEEQEEGKPNDAETSNGAPQYSPWTSSATDAENSHITTRKTPSAALMRPGSALGWYKLKRRTSFASAFSSSSSSTLTSTGADPAASTSPQLLLSPASSPSSSGSTVTSNQVYTSTRTRASRILLKKTTNAAKTKYPPVQSPPPKHKHNGFALIHTSLHLLRLRRHATKIDIGRWNNARILTFFLAPAGERVK